MERPPRDVLKDRLISGPAMRYAYLIAGLVQVRSVSLRHRAYVSWMGRYTLVFIFD
jgi:hypothetical protein